MTGSSFRRFPFPGQNQRESDQVWRPRSAVPPPAGAGPLRPEGRDGSCGLAQHTPWANWKVSGSSESVASGPFFCSFDAYRAPILAEPRSVRGSPDGERSCPSALGARALTSSPRKVLQAQRRPWTRLQSETGARSACWGSNRGPRASGAWRQRKRLWPGAAAALQRLRKRGFSGLLGAAGVRVLQTGSRGQLGGGGGASPGSPKRRRPALGGTRAPSRGDGLSPSPWLARSGVAGAFRIPKRSEKPPLSPSRAR